MKRATGKDFKDWFEAQHALEYWKKREMELRLLCVSTFFPNPAEGTNNMKLEDGSVLKMGHVINRSLDFAAYDALRKTDFKAAKIPANIVVQDPKLVLREYRKLSEDQVRVFDQCLIIKPGTPSLKVVPPKGDKEP